MCIDASSFSTYTIRRESALEAASHEVVVVLSLVFALWLARDTAIEARRLRHLHGLERHGGAREVIGLDALVCVWQ